jgi:molybdopterin/thiamine biosynthesis adenylyltransferase
VLIVGCGGLGANTARLLARSGYSEGITIADDDVVAMHNVYPQGFELADIGKTKVTAVAEYCAALGASVTTLTARLTRTSTSRAIETAANGGRVAVISAVDTMATRQAVAAACLRAPEHVDVLIDPRMGGLYGRIHILRPNTATPEEHERYLNTLHSDGDSVEAPCTERATPFCAMTLACMTVMAVVNQARLHIQGADVGYVERHLDMPDLRCFVMK